MDYLLLSLRALSKRVGHLDPHKEPRLESASSCLRKGSEPRHSPFSLFNPEPS
jgi:hypothetical protein